mgnify:CR=1 FL=1
MEIETLYEIYKEHPVITTDSRDCPTGSVFFALKGASFNGNAFAARALEQGCACAVVDEAAYAVAGDDRYVLVPDALQALQQLAALHRNRLHLPVVQVTGTNGKTTTKELIAAVLGSRFRVLYTRGNLNNHIGVPLTLLRLTPEHDIAVIETGANHPGEIAFLSRIVNPDFGLITNVGRAHLEGFGSFEGVKRTKGELYDYLRLNGGTAFLHTDDADLCGMAQGLPVLTYGTTGVGQPPRVQGEALPDGIFLTFRWRCSEGPWHEVRTRLVGGYNLANALAAVAVGLHFGVEPQQIDRALADYTPGNNRSQYLDTGRNHLIIDAYNANPTSMRAALENFARMPGADKRAILGDMRELGADSAAEHQRIVDLLVELGLEHVWLVGERFAATRHPFRSFPNVEEVRRALLSESVTGATLLIKGSNGTKLYTLPDSL